MEMLAGGLPLRTPLPIRPTTSDETKNPGHLLGAHAQPTPEAEASATRSSHSHWSPPAGSMGDRWGSWTRGGWNQELSSLVV